MCFRHSTTGLSTPRVDRPPGILSTSPVRLYNTITSSFFLFYLSSLNRELFCRVNFVTLLQPPLVVGRLHEEKTLPVWSTSISPPVFLFHFFLRIFLLFLFRLFLAPFASHIQRRTYKSLTIVYTPLCNFCAEPTVSDIDIYIRIYSMLVDFPPLLFLLVVIIFFAFHVCLCCKIVDVYMLPMATELSIWHV